NFTYAQVPDSINYQAVIRNANGTLIAQGKTVNFKFIVTVGISNYTETQLHTITNKFGLANLKIGAGVPSSSITKLKNLPWTQGNATLTVDIDTIGGTTFANISNTSLVTVPYAFYSDKAKAADVATTANFATNSGTANVATDIATLGFNAGTNILTVGNHTQNIPIPVIKRDTIVRDGATSNGLFVTPTTYVAGGGTQYNLYAKNQELTLAGNVLSLSGTPASTPISLPTYIYNAGNGLLLNTAKDTFSIDPTYIKAVSPTKNITRVKYNVGAKEVRIFTPLPKLEFNQATSFLTIKDTTNGIIKDSIDLSHLANKDTVVKVVAGLGVSVTPSVSGNVKTFTVTNTRRDTVVTFNNINLNANTFGTTAVTGTYPDFTVTSQKTDNRLLQLGINRFTSIVNGDPTSFIKMVDTIIHVITPTNQLITTVNDEVSEPIQLPVGLSSVYFKDTTLYTLAQKGATITPFNDTIGVVWKKQKKYTFLAGPTGSGTTITDTLPRFRTLTAEDFPPTAVIYATLPTGLSSPNYIPKFGSAPKNIQNSKLYEVASGNIGWNTITPLNNFVINSATTSTLQLTSNAALATSGFVAKFNGTDSYLSTKNDMLFTDDLATPTVRLKINNTNVFVGNSSNPIVLNLSKDLITNSSSGTTGQVLTSQGVGNPPQWKPVIGSDIWTKTGTTPNATITQTDVADNVNLGNSINKNPKVKLAVYSADTGIYTQAGKMGIYSTVTPSPSSGSLNYAGWFRGEVKILHGDLYNDGINVTLGNGATGTSQAAVNARNDGKGYAGYFTNRYDDVPAFVGATLIASNTTSSNRGIGVNGIADYSSVSATGAKIGYGVLGVNKGGLGNATLQSSTTTAQMYSAGVFGRAEITTSDITYGVMGITSSHHMQAAGVFGLAQVGASDGVRGITVNTSRGSAASFLNYANGNSTPTVYISNRDVNDSAAALYVDGGQIVKTRVVTGNYSQNRGDYIIISNANAGNTNVITLLDPATVIEGTVIIVRNTGAGALKIDLATGTAAASTIDVYSDKINNLGASITSTPGITSILATAGTPSSVVVTTLATVNTSLKFVSTKNGTTGTWIEY
ncbi:MAG: hypothetical protein ABL940_11655, partial [Bacteroidia bacterium]